MKKRLFYSVFLLYVLVLGLSGCASMFETQSTPVNTSLDGIWDRGDIVITISDTASVFTQINPNSSWYRVQNNGSINVGDQQLRNIKQTSNLRWAAQVRTSEEENYTNLNWRDCTIIMSSNGKTIEIVFQAAQGRTASNSTVRYTRVQ